MEANGMSGGTFSGMNTVMLGLELSPQPHHLQPQQNPNQPHPHQNIVSFVQNVDHQPQNQQSSVKQAYLYTATKSRSQHLSFSDDDEPGLAAEDSPGKRNISPWQRMKWTDNMVKLLIMVVFYIGDDQAVSEKDDAAGKKKGVNGSGALQKKGKWKSVSKAMMDRGFFVSPQQCEDKFNDLNKRYKRVNDILGKGTSCKVVEDQSLLETMDHLSPKVKEEVKKLLNSKHLFFREMCAYHNSCGGSAQHSAEVVGESSQILQHKKCLHSSDNSPNVPNLGRAQTEDSKIIKIESDDEYDDDDEEDDDEDDDDTDEVEDGARGHEKEPDIDVKTSHKRARNEMSGSSLRSPSVQEFSNELNYVIQDGTKSSWEKRQWMRIRLMHLEEQRMKYQCEAYKLEKQKMKWMKFSSRKERDMEAEKLACERMRLENDRMVLVIKQKEVELLDIQQQSMSSNRRADPPSVTK